MIELEPERHNLIVKMWTRLYKLDIEVGRCLSRRRRSYLHLLLNYFLFLLFQFVYEVRGEFEDHCYERASNRLVHKVLKLNLLTNEINSCTGLLE